jgi:hypothetical protein
MLARVDGAGIVRSGEYTLTRLAAAVVEYFLADEALTRESLTLLTGTLRAQLAEILAAARRADTEDAWREQVVAPLRITVGDLVGGIERRQRGLDSQQEEVQAEIAKLLQADWFGAVERCQSLLDTTTNTLRELNEVLLRDTHHFVALLQEIQALASEAEQAESEEAVQRVIEHVDRIAAWGGARQRAWSDYYQYVHRYPDAFLASSVVVCEGASEVGLIRGLDQYRTTNGHDAITAQGVALVDCGGGGADRPFTRADAFYALGYRVAVVRDDDKKPTTAVEATFIADGGTVVAWRDGRALEDELFLSLSDDGVSKLLDRAVELHGQDLVNDHIKSASQNAKDLNAIRLEALIEGMTHESRAILGKAARSKKAGWFKSVTWMEDASRDIVGPDLVHADADFRALINSIFVWAGDAG